MQGKTEKKQQKYKRQPGGSSMAVFPFLYSVRIKHLYGAFFLDITGFFAFSVVGCTIP